MLAKKSLGAAPAAEALYVEDVFSTYLYSGQSSGTITIDNGIDLSGEGGLVWIKQRNGTSGHQLCDTERGITNRLQTNTTGAQSSEAFLGSVTSTGFTLPANYGDVSGSTGTYASWTFRQAEKFFDVVTYTGNGSARTISHNLGSTPGCIIVKRTDTTGDWYVYHRSNTAAPETDYLLLNSTAATADLDTVWNDTAPTSTVFSVGTNSGVNANSGTYVAYLFAHDAGGFGDAGSDSIIKCGSYTGNGSTTGPSVNLGWEPQWVMVKNASAAYGWYITDNLRGFISSNTDPAISLLANDTSVESTYASPKITNIGFDVVGNSDAFNTNGSTYVYIAIRRGPMRTPTDATKVFTPTVYTGTNVDNRLIDTTIAPDFVMIRQRNDTVVPGMYTGSRLTGQEFLITGSTNAGATDADSFDAQIVSSVEYGNAFSSMNGVWVGNDPTRKFNANTTSDNHIIEAFKRAPGFFDVVCYSGNASTQSVSHNLAVAPELVIVKRRNSTVNWAVMYSFGGSSCQRVSLNLADAVVTSNYGSANIFTAAPTSTTLPFGSDSDVNGGSSTYIALLFASCPNVSKVGTYTGNGGSQTINCGFTNGARFVLIKQADNGGGSWYLFDSARGIVAGSDPFLRLNSTGAELTTDDAIDTDSSGFVVNNSNTNAYLNDSGNTYLYLAIA